MTLSWRNQVDSFNKDLRDLSAQDDRSEIMPNEEAFQLWAQRTLKIRRDNKTIFLIGNGASASMASHVAADLAKNAQVHTEVFSDLSLITAIANDMSYEEVFAEPLRRRMKGGDMLVAISSSGNSPNVVRAVREARNLKGFIVTLSAMDSANALRNSGNLCFYVPSQSYGMAETCHAAILHYWIDLIVDEVNGTGKRADE